MTDIVERVARAMCESDGAKWDAADCCETANGDEPEEQREYWLDKARAALTALLEPTEEMVEAGWAAPHDSEGVSDPADIWQAMLRTALGEKP